MSPRYRAGLWVVVILAVNWFTVTLTNPRDGILLGYFIGSLSANVTLAAAWGAFGPGRLVWRLPLSVAWVLMQLVCVAVNVLMELAPSNGLFLMGVLLGLQWLILQVPLWGISLGVGLGLRYGEAAPREAGQSEVRFGLRDLFILMGLVAVMLGVGRLLLPLVDIPDGFHVIVFVFLGVAGVFLTLPLLVATLLPRRVLPGIGAAILFITAGTFAEWTLGELLQGAGPGIEDFAVINAGASLVILLLAGAVRRCGYSLQRTRIAVGSVVESDDFAGM